MFYTLYFGVLLCVAGSQALYDSSSDVVELNPSNFDRLVTNSDEVWIVEFFAPWCGHCKNLVPEYKKAAKALRGIIKVGAVDADQHKSLSGKYGVTGFPTIKIFTGSKHTPYQGQRTADAFVDAGLKAAKERAYDNLGKKSSGGAGDKRQRYGHFIPWKKIQRTVQRLEKALRTPQNTTLTNATCKLEVQKTKMPTHQPKKHQKQIYTPRAQKHNQSRKPQVHKHYNRYKNHTLNQIEETYKTQETIYRDMLGLNELQGILFRNNIDGSKHRPKVIKTNIKHPQKNKKVPKHISSKKVAKHITKKYNQTTLGKKHMNMTKHVVQQKTEYI